MMTHFKLTINVDRDSYVGTSSVRGRGRCRGADPEPEASGSLAVGSSESSAGQCITYMQFCVCGARQFPVYVHVRVVVLRYLGGCVCFFSLLGNGLASDEFSVADGWYGCDLKPCCCERGGRREHSSSATAVCGTCRKGRAVSRRGICIFETIVEVLNIHRSTMFRTVMRCILEKFVSGICKCGVLRFVRFMKIMNFHCAGSFRGWGC